MWQVSCSLASFFVCVLVAVRFQTKEGVHDSGTPTCSLCSSVEKRGGGAGEGGRKLKPASNMMEGSGEKAQDQDSGEVHVKCPEQENAAQCGSKFPASHEGRPIRATFSGTASRFLSPLFMTAPIVCSTQHVVVALSLRGARSRLPPPPCELRGAKGGGAERRARGSLSQRKRAGEKTLRSFPRRCSVPVPLL